MKKVKVENYKKPNYSTLKMVTGKILPAGLVVATMITSASNAAVQSNEAVEDISVINETRDISMIAGGISYPILAGEAPYSLIEPTEKKPVSVLCNQEIIEFDVEPVWENDRILVPLRKIFETLGAIVFWDDETRTATALKGSNIIIIGIDDTKMLKNGEEITLDVAPKLVDGRTLVPIRAVSEGLGCDVLWNELDNGVVIECEEEEIVILGGAMSFPGN